MYCKLKLKEISPDEMKEWMSCLGEIAGKIGPYPVICKDENMDRKHTMVHMTFDTEKAV